MAFPKGHKGYKPKKPHEKKEQIEDTLKADYIWAYKKLGGRKALHEWAKNPKSTNDEFFRQFKAVVLSDASKSKGNLKDKKKIFLDDTES